MQLLRRKVLARRILSIVELTAPGRVMIVRIGSQVILCTSFLFIRSKPDQRATSRWLAGQFILHFSKRSTFHCYAWPGCSRDRESDSSESKYKFGSIKHDDQRNLAAGGASLFRGLSPGQRVGNAGRNILRADGLSLVDFGIIKNTRLAENVRIQLRADMFNSLNSRNFGIPNGSINSGANFLNQWATNGGNRRIVLGARLAF